MACIGDNCVDVSLDSARDDGRGEGFAREFAGGNALNVAVALARRGLV